MSDDSEDERPGVTILFYSQRGDFGSFSNFSPHPVDVEGVTWPTTEHYFQAMKFPQDQARQERIRTARTPMQAKRIAWEAEAAPRADWHRYRDEVMLAALRAKFVQHPLLRDLLLSTGDEELVEHTAKDAYWGDGGDGKGRNTLGRLLMRVRAELRCEPDGPTRPPAAIPWDGPTPRKPGRNTGDQERSGGLAG